MSYKQIINVSSNKSYFQRVLIAAILDGKMLIINNFTYSDDNLVIIDCFLKLGYSIKLQKDALLINDRPRSHKEFYKLNIKSSGFAARVLPIILMFETAPIRIDYDRRVYERDLKELYNIFNQFGKEINIYGTYLEFYPSINNRHINKISVSCEISSQYATALLFLQAYYSEFILEIINPNSKQYIDLTMDILALFGFEYKNMNYRSITLINKSIVDLSHINIEGDWSGAANLIIMASLLGKATFSNLNINSTQSDSIIIKLLKDINGKVNIIDDLLVIEKAILTGFDFDAEDCPDLVPALVPLALYTNKACIIRNVERLKFKESDRLNELISSYNKLGANLSYKSNSLQINTMNLKYCQLDCKNDHRLAMSYAIAYKLINPQMQLKVETCVNKSYPMFYEQANMIEAYE
ncbi:MAG TPA: hypothetical protein PLE30_04300 [Candidatus Kapabacteria bacterium]|nr:hypothetical protein [Candidatus Kapabacteria bacterium]